MTDAEIAGMQQTSASALPDLCTITRPVTEPTLDEDTLILEPGDVETVYAGPCRVRPRGSQEQDVQVGELHETLGPYVGTLPANVAEARRQAPTGFTVQGDPNDVTVDDYLTLTATTDPSSVARSFQLVHVGRGGWHIDRRIGLQDREQPLGIEVAS